MIVILIVILFYLGLSLILPLVLILKWESRPVLAFICATILCCSTMAATITITDIMVNGPGALEFYFIMGMVLIAVLFGSPILALVQWRRRRKRKAFSKYTISETF